MSFDSPRPDAVAHSLLLPAAEMGLLYRPIHLLVGHLPWSECLSPYTRDLTITLDQFVQKKGLVGQSLRESPKHPSEREDWYYEIAEHFLNEDPKRLEEKRQIEANLGILRLYANFARTLWLDSKRIDWNATDSRLSHLQSKLGNPNPVWLVLHPDDFQECSELVQALIQKISRQLLSCSVERETLSGTNPKSIPNFHTYDAKQTKQSIYQMAVQTFAQTLGEPTQELPHASPPKAGPLHRIKA